MTSIMRRTVRGAAAGMGALAIVAGTAACGGLVGGGDGEDEGDGGTGTEETQEESGESEEGADDSSESEDTETTEESEDTEGAEDTESAEDAGEGAEDTGEETGEGSGTDEGDTAEDGGDAAGGEALTEEDTTAVGDLYFEFLQALGANDGESACSLITNPMTGGPMEGVMLDECAKGFEGEGEAGGVDPSLVESMDRSMIEGVDNGDGTASATLMGQDVGFTFVKADDGTWYIDGSQFV